MSIFCTILKFIECVPFCHSQHCHHTRGKLVLVCVRIIVQTLVFRNIPSVLETDRSFGFGFGFGAERRLVYCFGDLSVSAEGQLQTFRRLSAVAESHCVFRR